MQTGVYSLEMKHPPLVADNKRAVFKIDTHIPDTVRSFPGFIIACTGRDASHQGRAGLHKIVPDHNSSVSIV